MEKLDELSKDELVSAIMANWLTDKTVRFKCATCRDACGAMLPDYYYVCDKCRKAKEAQ